MANTNGQEISYHSPSLAILVINVVVCLAVLIISIIASVFTPSI